MKDEDLTGGQWRSTGSWWPGKKFSCQSGLYLTLFFFFYFRKIEAKQNKSHRMQNTSTSRSTDFRRQKTITSKTPLTLYGRGFCASDGTPTTTGSPAGPQSNQNVWVLPPISRNAELPTLTGSLPIWTICRCFWLGSHYVKWTQVPRWHSSSPMIFFYGTLVFDYFEL